MDMSEDLLRLNVLQEKMNGLLQRVYDLKAENGRLKNENAMLNDEAARLREQMGVLEQSTTQYLSERDNIKDRVENLIQMLEHGLGQEF